MPHDRPAAHGRRRRAADDRIPDPTAARGGVEHGRHAPSADRVRAGPARAPPEPLVPIRERHPSTATFSWVACARLSCGAPSVAALSVSRDAALTVGPEAGCGLPLLSSASAAPTAAATAIAASVGRSRPCIGQAPATPVGPPGGGGPPSPAPDDAAPAGLARRSRAPARPRAARPCVRRAPSRACVRIGGCMRFAHDVLLPGKTPLAPVSSRRVCSARVGFVCACSAWVCSARVCFVRACSVCARSVPVCSGRARSV